MITVMGPAQKRDDNRICGLDLPSLISLFSVVAKLSFNILLDQLCYVAEVAMKTAVV
jgi:hypothetical protein